MVRFTVMRSGQVTGAGVARSSGIGQIDSAGEEVRGLASLVTGEWRIGLFPTVTRAALESLPPSPEHMFWFEYNFLYVLAGGGKATKAALELKSLPGEKYQALDRKSVV